MATLIDTIKQQLTPDTINQVSQQLNVDPATAKQAVQAALPVVLSGMASNADDPVAADMIHSEADNHEALLGGLIPGSSGNAGGILGGLAGALGSGGLGGVLGNVLGQRSAPVQDGVTKASGLDSQKSKQLMMILVPIVLAALAHRKRSASMQPADVGPVLRADARSAQEYAERKSPRLGGLLGGIMDHVMQQPRADR